MEIIVPAAGLSTRFPNMKPKYLLRDANGDMMIKRALKPYLNNRITIGILEKHAEEYNAVEELSKEFQGYKMWLTILPQVTKGPADTVYQIIKSSNFGDSEFLIKDCDSYFEHEPKGDNYVCITKISDHKVLINLAAKSFIVSNEQGIITDIVEKNVVSDKFCVGGYKFRSTKLYCESFERIKGQVNEIFVSHVIQDHLLNNEIFFENEVTNYYDVGTLEDWKKYNESIS